MQSGRLWFELAGVLAASPPFVQENLVVLLAGGGEGREGQLLLQFDVAQLRDRSRIKRLCDQGGHTTRMRLSARFRIGRKPRYLGVSPLGSR